MRPIPWRQNGTCRRHRSARDQLAPNARLHPAQGHRRVFGEHTGIEDGTQTREREPEPDNGERLNCEWVPDFSFEATSSNSNQSAAGTLQPAKCRASTRSLPPSQQATRARVELLSPWWLPRAREVRRRSRRGYHKWLGRQGQGQEGLRAPRMAGSLGR